MTQTESGSRAKSGRPRDPDMESRVFAAALAVYAEAGWSGFSFDVVARAAGVGKHAMYLRWSTREALLVAALEDSIVAVPDLDRGSLRDDLLHLLTSMLHSLSGPSGLAPLRVLLEAHAAPGSSTALPTSPLLASKRPGPRSVAASTAAAAGRHRRRGAGGLDQWRGHQPRPRHPLRSRCCAGSRAARLRGAGAAAAVADQAGQERPGISSDTRPSRPSLTVRSTR